MLKLLKILENQKFIEVLFLALVLLVLTLRISFYVFEWGPKAINYPTLQDKVPAKALMQGFKIDLNTAEEGELEAIPNIGPKRALAIISLRNQAGSFVQVEQLLEIKGISKRTLDQIAPYVVVHTQQ